MAISIDSPALDDSKPVAPSTPAPALVNMAQLPASLLMQSTAPSSSSSTPVVASQQLLSTPPASSSSQSPYAEDVPFGTQAPGGSPITITTTVGSGPNKRKEVMTLPLPPGALPPRKRAKTKDEKEQRRIERIMRNRQAAHASREKKRRHVEELEKRCVSLTSENEKLHSGFSQVQTQNSQLFEQFKRLASLVESARSSGDLSALDTAKLMDEATSTLKPVEVPTPTPMDDDMVFSYSATAPNSPGAMSPDSRDEYDAPLPTSTTTTPASSSTTTTTLSSSTATVTGPSPSNNNNNKGAQAPNVSPTTATSNPSTSKTSSAAQEPVDAAKQSKRKASKISVDSTASPVKTEIKTESVEQAGTAPTTPAIKTEPADDIVLNAAASPESYSPGLESESGSPGSTPSLSSSSSVASSPRSYPLDIMFKTEHDAFPISFGLLETRSHHPAEMMCT